MTRHKGGLGVLTSRKKKTTGYLSTDGSTMTADVDTITADGSVRTADGDESSSDHGILSPSVHETS
ncbi:hypothetical protein [Sphingobacterium sp. FBM7-1]|uniref:hypothetical protein n=1 Tax=Sphingobacterium sp. FBM7-1 TaxID=2886688 RepID=UPI001D1049F8|nr:hypothetical protein [Sphingobacterium sp. FBM7-1]MCC2599214.1 hypothetical protein [Sphingobacterium sp. FBM7-1]